MLTTLKKIFGKKPDLKFKELISKGAVIIDVRTREEFVQGHIKESVNIPLSQLRENPHRFPDKKAILITCCASGGRSEAAKQLLNAYGYLDVYNGGGWKSLAKKI